VFEREFLLTANTAGRNIYQLGLNEHRIVRLLPFNADRRPVAVAFDQQRRVMYWTDVAAINIASLPLTSPVSVARPTVVFSPGSTGTNSPLLLSRPLM